MNLLNLHSKVLKSLAAASTQTNDQTLFDPYYDKCNDNTIQPALHPSLSHENVHKYELCSIQ